MFIQLSKCYIIYLCGVFFADLDVIIGVSVSVGVAGVGTVTVVIVGVVCCKVIIYIEGAK